MLRDFALFASINDKHKIKIGEPNFPLASVERGRQVVVAFQSQLLAADHDFTKFSITPLVIYMYIFCIWLALYWYTTSFAFYQPSYIHLHLLHPASRGSIYILHPASQASIYMFCILHANSASIQHLRHPACQLCIYPTP